MENLNEVSDRELIRIHRVDVFGDPRSVAQIADEIRRTGSPAVKNTIEIGPNDTDNKPVEL